MITRGERIAQKARNRERWRRIFRRSGMLSPAGLSATPVRPRSTANCAVARCAVTRGATLAMKLSRSAEQRSTSASVKSPPSLLAAPALQTARVYSGARRSQREDALHGGYTDAALARDLQFPGALLMH